ncbi:MAG: CHASE2 domain-containing protein, partial [Aliifodinibius sp.]|nr:CHASE2 domain-containing protein [Fodinibius sp.]NIV15351.1 CHASE2 domain-containing protein [Fodinibius sp.]NIY29338.1 CHASE2 domain-containing protein [Fodinibius sp.]
ALAVIRKYMGYHSDVTLTDTDDGFKFGDFNIATYDHPTMLINFAGPEGTFPTYSFESVIDDSTFFLGEFDDLDYFEELLAEGVFEDKIVLIGSTVAELHDNFPTPFLGYKGQPKEMPGVEIHANAINTILNGIYVEQPNYFFYLLMVLVLV